MVLFLICGMHTKPKVEGMSRSKRDTALVGKFFMIEDGGGLRPMCIIVSGWIALG
jgi:hypothetical protein